MERRRGTDRKKVWNRTLIDADLECQIGGQYPHTIQCSVVVERLKSKHFYKYKQLIKIFLACWKDEPLVSGSDPIPDAYMTASSDYDTTWVAHTARLNHALSWSPADETSPMWLQVSKGIIVE